MNTPEEHIKEIISDLVSDIQKKYEAGQIEHGGNLWRKPVLPFAWEEVLDLPVYLHTLKFQHDLMKHICRRAMTDQMTPDEAVLMVYNILTVGNPEGVRESGD